jgi:hypothetical protein
MEINYGLMVVGVDGKIYHMYAIEEKPSDEIKEEFLKELYSDEKFNWITPYLENGQMKIMEASKETVENFISSNIDNMEMEE